MAALPPPLRYACVCAVGSRLSKQVSRIVTREKIMKKILPGSRPSKMVRRWYWEKKKTRVSGIINCIRTLTFEVYSSRQAAPLYIRGSAPFPYSRLNHRPLRSYQTRSAFRVPAFDQVTRVVSVFGVLFGFDSAAFWNNRTRRHLGPGASLAAQELWYRAI